MPWDGNKRSDGMRVEPDPREPHQWIIVPQSSDQRVRHFCPCCGKAILSSTAAQKVADAVYPEMPTQ